VEVEKRRRSLKGGCAKKGRKRTKERVTLLAREMRSEQQ